MKKILLLLLCVVGVSQLHAQGSNLPEMSLKNLKGEQVNLQDLNNESAPVVFSFWATWCMPCLKELTAINDEIDDWRQETGVKFFAVSVDDSKTIGRVAPLINGKGWDYEVLLDTNSDLKRAFNIPNVPHVLIVKNGKIVYRHAGYLPGAEAQLYQKIKEFSN